MKLLEVHFWNKVKIQQFSYFSCSFQYFTKLPRDDNFTLTPKQFDFNLSGKTECRMIQQSNDGIYLIEGAYFAYNIVTCESSDVIGKNTLL